jgi:hypothetical protein
MKKIFILLVLAGGYFYASAQSDQYMNAMKTAVANLDTAKTAETLQQLSNKFQRIATAEKKEWLPYYYSSYCIANSAFLMKNKKMLDDYLDNAENLQKKADSLNPNNSEIYTLQALIYSSRIAVNPMTRGKKYGTLSNETGEKAKALDPTNPRPYLLRGQGLFYTPSMFGGGKDKAKPVLEEAMQKYATFKPASEIAPHWGEDRAKMLLEQCK